MHDKPSQFSVHGKFTFPGIQPYQQTILDFLQSGQPFRMTPRPRKYFAVISLHSGGKVELPRQETPEAALHRAKDHGYSEDQITIKMETPIPGQSETVTTETLRERFEKWAGKEWHPELLRRTTSYPGTDAETIYRENEIQLAWEAFQEGAKAVS